MPKPKRGPRLGSGPAHQRSLLANQASALFVHGRIRTTHTKARQLRPYAEKLITKAKKGDLHARRQVASKLRDRDVVTYLFDSVAPRFADRPGGYTRILKLGPRQGDNTPMALIELVEQGDRPGEEVIEEARQRRGRGLMGRLKSRFGLGGQEEPDAGEAVDESEAERPTGEPGAEVPEESGADQPD